MAATEDGLADLVGIARKFGILNLYKKEKDHAKKIQLILDEYTYVRNTYNV